MVAGAFPLIKLGALAVRQLAKPIANIIKSRAKESPVFRTYICMPPAQAYHWLEVNVKMKMLGLGKPTNVQKLNEQMAIETGAELLGEFVIYMTAVITIALEYIRQSRKSTAESLAVEEKWNKVENRIEELEFLVDKHRAEINQLNRVLFSIKSIDNKSVDNNSGIDKNSNKSLIGKAINEVTEKLSPKK